MLNRKFTINDGPSIVKDKFKWKKGITGVPVVKECIGYMECEIREVYIPGNHTLFVGEVMAGKDMVDDSPLTTSDYDGMYIGKD